MDQVVGGFMKREEVEKEDEAMVSKRGTEKARPR
jgi:hypothetical protein